MTWPGPSLINISMTHCCIRRSFQRFSAASQLRVFILLCRGWVDTQLVTMFSPYVWIGTAMVIDITQYCDDNRYPWPHTLFHTLIMCSFWWLCSGAPVVRANRVPNCWTKFHVSLSSKNLTWTPEVFVIWCISFCNRPPFVWFCPLLQKNVAVILPILGVSCYELTYAVTSCVRCGSGSEGRIGGRHRIWGTDRGRA